MKHALAFMLVMVVATHGTMPAIESTASAQNRIDLNDYLWKKRPLLLFVPSAEESSYHRISNRLEDQKDQIKDRDMVIIEIFEPGLVREDGNRVNDESGPEWRRHFAVTASELTIILIGKDGGEKLRQIGRLDLNTIFARIDSMPMRQQEMGQKGQ